MLLEVSLAFHPDYKTRARETESTLREDARIIIENLFTRNMKHLAQQALISTTSRSAREVK